MLYILLNIFCKAQLNIFIETMQYKSCFIIKVVSVTMFMYLDSVHVKGHQ